MRKMLKKLRGMWSSFYQGLKKWVFAPGRGVLVLAIYIILAIIAIAAVVCMALGCLGSAIFAVLSLPALLLWLGFNWVVPALGGPAITFKMAIGFVLLAAVALGILSTFKE